MPWRNFRKRGIVRGPTIIGKATTRMEAAASGHVSFFFQAEDGIRDYKVTGVQTCALPIYWSQMAPTSTPKTTKTFLRSPSRRSETSNRLSISSRAREQNPELTRVTAALVVACEELLGSKGGQLFMFPVLVFCDVGDRAVMFAPSAGVGRGPRTQRTLAIRGEMK